MLLENITFGVELEYAGISRHTANLAVVGALQELGLYRCHSMSYPYTATMTDGRTWRTVTDGSVSCGSEVVSPVLTMAGNDMALLQNITRRLVAAGGQWGAGSGAGLHCHIGMQNWSDKQMRNLLKFMRKYERILVSMVGTTDNRESMWCRPMQSSVVEAIEAGKNRIEIAEAQDGRYVGVNCRSILTLGTVEMRFLEATGHAGKLRSQIELMLMVALYCANASRTSSKQRDTQGNTKYAARILMKQIGMVGARFKTVRKHLLANLEGDSVLNRDEHHGYESWSAGIAANEPSCWVPGRASGRG